MARYIDSDKLIAHLHSQAEGRPIAFVTMTQLTSSISFVEKISAACSEATSEVAREICCEIEEEIVAALESNYRALKEWDDGRCNDYILEMVGRINGKIDALRGIEGFVEELKKKYEKHGG